jgi:hypothetical protein
MGITGRRLIEDDENLNKSACTDFSVGTGAICEWSGFHDSASCQHR